jgi:cell division septation protein DedD
MKFVRVPDFDPSAADIDKEAMGWSLSWKPKGCCDRFTRETILAFAPPTSGVYGLFNFDCQILIGEAANMQEALLRHESETDFQSLRLQPTGFTFEPCAAELRKFRAAELIAKFHPALQTEAALSETGAPSNCPIATDVRPGDRESESYAGDHEFPLHDKKRPKARRRFQLDRPQIIALAAALIASAATIFDLVKLADESQKQVVDMGKKPPEQVSITQSGTASQAGAGSGPQKVASKETARGPANKNSEPTPTEPDVYVYAVPPNGAVQLAATEASAADDVGIQALSGQIKTIPTADSPGSANLDKKWSVQISSVSAKDVADNLVQQLITEGYDGYVVRAEVKGQAYYRVRVGPFAARKEAESARQSLTRHDGYAGAYLTSD